MVYRTAGAVAPEAPRVSLRMRRVGAAFEWMVRALTAAMFVAALAFFSWDTLACTRNEGDVARCELRHRGLLGDSGELTPGAEPDLDVPTDLDDRTSSLRIHLVGGRVARVATSESRGRRAVAAYRAFMAGREREVSQVLGVTSLWFSALFAVCGAMFVGVVRMLPSSAVLRVFDDGGVEVETRRPGRRPAVSRFITDAIEEVRVEPQDDGNLAHLVLVSGGAPTTVFTGLPDDLERARAALAAELTRRKGPASTR
jgi:hypothetical protein